MRDMLLILLRHDTCHMRRIDAYAMLPDAAIFAALTPL